MLGLYHNKQAAYEYRVGLSHTDMHRYRPCLPHDRTQVTDAVAPHDGTVYARSTDEQHEAVHPARILTPSFR